MAPQMQPAFQQPAAQISVNSSGQMVNSDGSIVVMDGGGRPWSAPYKKIMAHDTDGCYCDVGFGFPCFATSKITSEGEDEYSQNGIADCWMPFCSDFKRIPNTNSFRECCGEVQKWKQLENKPKGQDLTVTTNWFSNCLFFKIF